MIRAFAYVTLHSFKNRIVSRVKRLKQPRYLVSAIAGFAYLWFMSLRHIVAGSGKFARILPASDVGIDIISVIILGLMLFAWALPGQSGGLEFTEAEIQFLFPAPLTRRQLLLYKIFRMQPQILISSTIMSFLMFRQSRFVGVWLSFVTLSIYFTVVSLGRARLKLAHVGFLARLVIALALASAFGWLFYNTAMHTSAAGQAALRQQVQRGNFRSMAASFDQPFQDPVIHGILSFPRFFAGAVMPKSVPMLAASCLALVGLAFLFFELGARLNVSFEEASITASQKKAQRAERMHGRTGTRVAFKRMPAPFRLPRNSSPELAILWKNLVAMMRISIVWAIFLAVIFSVIAVEVVSTRNHALLLSVGIMALCFCGLFPLLGSGLFTQDLRLDLPRMEILKTYPISGERLVAAEIAGPLAMVSLLELLLLAGTSIILGFAVPEKLKFFASPQFVVMAMLFTIPVCAAQLLIRNAAAVFFPAWVTRSKEEMKGFMVFGQRLVMMIGNLFILALALLPAALLCVPAYLIANRYFHGSSFVLAAAIVPSVMLLGGEVWLGVRLLGAQFDRLDVSAEFDTIPA